MTAGPRICLGQIGAAHGVRGEVRLRSFTSDPGAIAGYGPLESESGRVFEIETMRPVKDHFIARLSGVRDRDDASALTNTKLYVPRERLPEPDAPDEFYHADLVGLAVFDPAGAKLGVVVAVHNFGAGDLIEMQFDETRRTAMVPFNETTVPVIDISAGRMVVAAPPEMLASGSPAGEEEAGESAGSSRRQQNLSGKRQG